ncbi:MAG: class I adenylate-forming enzyme family protein [Actinomycetota bacterium]|nr:class I adenylate-forming enzyme family protein [Actinomycetota bacterium]
MSEDGTPDSATAPAAPAPPVGATLADLVSSAAADVPDAVALVHGATRLTWAALEEEVARVAHGLVAAGVVAGHRVALAMVNRPELVVSYLAVLRVQAVAVPLNPRATAEEVARMLADSGARMVLVDEAAVSVVRVGVARLETELSGATDRPGGTLPAELLERAVVPRVVVAGTTLRPGERSYDHLRAERGREHPPLVDPERLATLLYTSGASGRPRAVMLSHRALLANVEQVARVQPSMIGPGDVVLGALPLFHVYGLNAVLGGVLRHRATLVLVDAYDPDAVLDLVLAEGVTVLPVAPTVVGHLLGLERLAERLAPVRLVLSGSAPLDADQVAAFHGATGIAVHQGYGLTEAAPVVTSTLCVPPADAGEDAGEDADGPSAQPDPGSVGTALPGIEIRLVDDHGHTPLQGDPGQVSIRGDNLFSGYWPDGDDAPDEDGWWATGDVGFLAPDGQLFLVDRVKELVIVSGFSVYPTEIEDVIEEVPGVREVAVIGVPDEDTGEAVVAYVVAPDQDPGTVEAAVRARCVVRLARFKQPRRIEVVDALPHTVTGKVRKGSLRAAERRRHLELL